MTAGGVAVLAVAVAAATAALAAAVAPRLAQAGLVRSNYRGAPVTTGLGVALVAGPLVTAALGAWLSPAAPATSLAVGPPPLAVAWTPAAPGAAGPAGGAGGLPAQAVPTHGDAPPSPGPAGGLPPSLVHLLGPAPTLLGLVAATTLVGLIDDLWDEPVRGWRGHLGAGRGWTGGRLKLLAVPLLAWVLVPTRGWVPRLLAAALVAAAANGMNLLDRRPGRALKAFFTAWLLMAAALPPGALALLPLALAALVLLGPDLEERAMLGDAGSNALGAALGWALVAFAPPVAHGLALAGLVVLHAIAEFLPLSRLIDAVGPLRWLDRLGTRPHAAAPRQGSPWAKE
ncbi:hypothetical protein E1B22_09435 [Thermaerobacter sp. FW80]|uniref:hypothetical protein n=1 Tax=Thermaerobacter sp. FW80 TaxID=2546351 RepID=UPI001074B184|nr:hypothetical protein [Thermaerobacter sp. FW80]QBS37958.1 hypothetical protein E1B22_09435 [Thermaerobacter sp. FW80]